MKGRVLVTGGLGYIGSHTSVELLAQGYEVLLGGQPEQHPGGASWTASRRLRAHDPNGSKSTSPTPPPAVCALEGQHLDGIIHFAAYKAVGESVRRAPEVLPEQPVQPDQSAGLRVEASPAVASSSAPLAPCMAKQIELPITERCPGQSGRVPLRQHQANRGGDHPRSGRERAGLTYDRPALLQPHWGPRHPPRLGELPLGVPQNLGALHHPERGRICAAP